MAYTVLLLPIAACRFAEWSGHQVPFGATIFRFAVSFVAQTVWYLSYNDLTYSDSVFLLSGFVNVVLFLTTRRVLPMHTVLPRRVSTLFPSFGESFAAMGSYSLASYATATQVEKPVVCEDTDGVQNQNLQPHPPRPFPPSPARAHTPFSPPSQYTGTSPSTSETFDPGSHHQHSAGTTRHSFEKEADVTGALHDGESARSRVVSDPPSLMIFIPATAFKER